MIKLIELPTERDSENVAKRLATCLTSPLVLTFSGDIGAGKTTLIRAMLRGLGVTSSIKSPTFSLVESYETSRLQIHHFDLYRVNDESELDYLGFRDFFSDDAVCCIEWPERVELCQGLADVAFSLRLKNAGREMQAHALSVKGISMLSCLLGES